MCTVSPSEVVQMSWVRLSPFTSRESGILPRPQRRRDGWLPKAVAVDSSIISHLPEEEAVWEGRSPRQAAALTEEGLAAIRATAELPRTGPRGRTHRARTARRRGLVDIALVSVMRDAMLQRSEAARASGGSMSILTPRGKPGSSASAPVARSRIGSLWPRRLRG